MIDKSTLQKTAALSRLNLDEQEQEQLLKEMAQIMGHFQALEAVDTTGVEPLYTPVEMKNLWRVDKAHCEQTPEEIFKNATDILEGRIKVPQVVK